MTVSDQILAKARQKIAAIERQMPVEEFARWLAAHAGAKLIYMTMEDYQEPKATDATVEALKNGAVVGELSLHDIVLKPRLPLGTAAKSEA